jgi:thiosulfate reductase cytochrome b subunit
MKTLSPATSAFVLAALIAVLFNTGLACAKDAYAPLNNFMKSLSGSSWTTHGAVDLVLFFGLGFIFMKTGAAEKIGAKRLIGALIGAVGVAGLGLAVWYAFV